VNFSKLQRVDEGNIAGQALNSNFRVEFNNEFLKSLLSAPVKEVFIHLFVKSYDFDRLEILMTLDEILKSFFNY
jgi:hypothetical protein